MQDRKKPWFAIACVNAESLARKSEFFVDDEFGAEKAVADLFFVFFLGTIGILAAILTFGLMLSGYFDSDERQVSTGLFDGSLVTLVVAISSYLLTTAIFKRALINRGGLDRCRKKCRDFGYKLNSESNRIAAVAIFGPIFTCVFTFLILGSYRMFAGG